MVTPSVAEGRLRRWRIGCLAALFALLCCVAAIAPHLHNSAELVRLRNALLFDAADIGAAWTPDTTPADFLHETAPPSAKFQARISALELQAMPSDWERALAIARHLLHARQGRVGQPIQSNLEHTYNVITDTGAGYCGDYADVFAALALAAGLDVRSWAFSFDGFGGRGHVFNEVWDRGAQRWMMIDAFHNYVFIDASGQPVSALEFRAALQRDPGALRFVAIEPNARPVFVHEERARDFYLRGLDQWYLWWGNNVFSYDQALLVRAFGPLSRSLEQLGGIAQGVHPRIRVLATDSNRLQVQRMLHLQQRLWVAAWAGGAALLAAVVCGAGWWRARRAVRAGT